MAEPGNIESIKDIRQFLDKKRQRLSMKRNFKDLLMKILRVNSLILSFYSKYSRSYSNSVKICYSGACSIIEPFAGNQGPADKSRLEL